ncbi:MAG: dihydrofolate reductase [Bacteroidales bacterium]|nr:dihydrofolate reductase [Bacteroidales bacterium]
MKHLTIIAAVGRDGAIGRGGDLAFHISADLRRFKALTTGHTVIMGRRTFESLPKGALPDRRNIVITRTPGFTAPGIEVADSLEKAIGMTGDENAFIIGGGTVYHAAMALADRLELTSIDADTPDADTFFPSVSETDWTVETESAPETDPRSGVTYTFRTLRRKPH